MYNAFSSSLNNLHEYPNTSSSSVSSFFLIAEGSKRCGLAVAMLVFQFMNNKNKQQQSEKALRDTNTRKFNPSFQGTAGVTGRLGHI